MAGELDLPMRRAWLVVEMPNPPAVWVVAGMAVAPVRIFSGFLGVLGRGFHLLDGLEGSDRRTGEGDYLLGQPGREARGLAGRYPGERRENVR